MVTVCAEVVVRNEALFLEESIRSIADVFDEIIVVDHRSVDETPDILARLADEVPGLSVHDGANLSYAACRNLIAASTRCDWIWKWDADYVAYDDHRGPKALIAELPEFDRAGRNMILLHGPNCGPTLETTLASHPRHGHNGDIKLMRREIVHYETAQYADTYVPPSPDAVVKAWRNRESDVAHFVQLDQLKLAERLILRDLMFDHDRKLHSGKTDMDLESWMKRSMVGKLEKIIERLMKGMAADVVPFDFERWGPILPYFSAPLARCHSRSWMGSFNRLTSELGFRDYGIGFPRPLPPAP